MTDVDKKEEMSVRATGKRRQKSEEIPGSSNCRIRMSQHPIDLLNRNFRHARFIRNLQEINKEQSDEARAGNSKTIDILLDFPLKASELLAAAENKNLDRTTTIKIASLPHLKKMKEIALSARKTLKDLQDLDFIKKKLSQKE